MRRFATGITVVTTVHDGSPRGFTANAFCSVSADPPLVLICVNREAHSHLMISASGIFCVNVMRADQEDLARHFAAKIRERQFEGIDCRTDATGAPVLGGALAHLDCELAEEYTAGSHTIFVGRVVSCAAGEGAPLGYYDGAYRDFGRCL